MSQLTITGNSHTIALNQGLGQVPEAAGVTVFGLGAGVYETEAFSATEAGRVVLTQPVYAENLVRFTGQDHIAPDRLWGICMGTHNPRLYGDRIWTGAAAPSALAGMNPSPGGNQNLPRTPPGRTSWARRTSSCSESVPSPGTRSAAFIGKPPL